MTFSKSTKYLIIGLLIILNFIIRIPSVPHEIGNDSFAIHILANSISVFGYAKWWFNLLSVFGMYPYSECSAVPFILSGISQCTGIDMEHTIWLYCIIIGLFSTFTAYLLAGIIWNNDIFKFLIAFLYSLSPGILTFSTWDATARGLFMVLLPLFTYLLLKIRAFMKYIILIFILFILLMTTHHYFYMTFPIFFSLIILTILYKLKGYVKFKIPNNFVSIAVVIMFLGMFLVPFFTGMFIEGSRYAELHIMLENNIRYTGVLIFLTVPGLMYLSLRYNKRFEEIFLLLTLLFLTIFLYIQTYAHYFIIIFSCILIGIALTNISRTKRKRKYAFSIIIIMLFMFIIFSGFYQHWRTHKGKVTAGQWYMDEEEYAGALWMKDNIDMNRRVVGNDNWLSKRMFAISGVPSLLEDVSCIWLVYGFAKIEDTPIVKNSPLSTSFYMDNPYVIDTRKFVSAGSYAGWLNNVDINKEKGIIQKFNFSYAIENQNIGKNRFIQSLYREKNNIYDNGKVRIWCLD